MTVTCSHESSTTLGPERSHKPAAHRCPWRSRHPFPGGGTAPAHVRETQEVTGDQAGAQPRSRVPGSDGTASATVVFCNGCGVDSMALLHLWCTKPKSRDFDLDELLVITAITGDEYRSTIDAANAHLVPMLRAHGIRFLQVARGGQSTHDGYDVLADSTAPTELIPRGAWHLGEETEQALTVPQIVSGRRLCSVDCTKSV